ncbi:hypothetical protein AB0L05_36725 [Nonomuraea pusilla]|uniref:hypothetical protein n=1 Tax=Nonomuraea pusilla TaxID=46177 RepID=UPI00331DADCF
MSGSFADAVRERARSAYAALENARREGDTQAALVAEDEWEDALRLARAHGVQLDEPGGAAP